MQVEIVEGVSRFPREQWDALYGQSAEGFDYLLACERAKPDSFEFAALVALAEEGFLACAPVFKTQINLDLVLDGFARTVVRGLGKLLPRSGMIPIIGIGTPYAHDARLAFAPGCDLDTRRRALRALIAELEREARSEKAAIVLVKDLSARLDADLREELGESSYGRITGLPIATLKVPESEDAYFAGLSGNMRSNLRRRLKRAKHLRVDIRTSTDGLDDQLHALRNSTLQRAASDFDVFAETSPDYYREVLAQMGANARLLTYWRDDALLGFSLVLIDRDCLVQTYNGMRYPEGPDNGLFYLDWMTQLRLCMEHDIPEMRSGVTTYLIKARLGCTFHRSYIYVRHLNPILAPIVRAATPWINMEKSDPGLIELGADAPFA